MGRHQQPIKSRRTQTNKVAANWWWWWWGGPLQKRNVFLFSCSTNGSYFHPLSSIRADIARDIVGAVKHTLSEHALDGFTLLCVVNLQASSRSLRLHRGPLCLGPNKVL